VRQQHHLVTSRFAADLVVSRRLFANTRANGTPDFGLAGLGDRPGEGVSDGRGHVLDHVGVHPQSDARVSVSISFGSSCDGVSGKTGSPNAVLNTKSDSGQSDSMTSRSSACRAR
jgi:hypothetical protein